MSIFSKTYRKPGVFSFFSNIKNNILFYITIFPYVKDAFFQKIKNRNWENIFNKKQKVSGELEAENREEKLINFIKFFESFQENFVKRLHEVKGVELKGPIEVSEDIEGIDALDLNVIIFKVSDSKNLVRVSFTGGDTLILSVDLCNGDETVSTSQSVRMKFIFSDEILKECAQWLSGIEEVDEVPDFDYVLAQDEKARKALENSSKTERKKGKIPPE
ncbi:MAG: hypothetical protein V4439_01150 [Patescibacteria group bacterium]